MLLANNDDMASIKRLKQSFLTKYSPTNGDKQTKEDRIIMGEKFFLVRYNSNPVRQSQKIILMVKAISQGGK